MKRVFPVTWAHPHVISRGPHGTDANKGKLSTCLLNDRSKELYLRRETFPEKVLYYLKKKKTRPTQINDTNINGPPVLMIEEN